MGRRTLMLDLPVSPPHPLDVRSSEVIEYQDVVWRVYFTRGEYPAAWNSFREFGPLASSRWDPHPPPPRESPHAAIYYAAASVDTCICEFFQAGRRIDVGSFEPHLTGWLPDRALRLLDLTSAWPTRSHGSGALAASPHRATTQGWARAIREQLPDVDGLYARATTTQQPTVTLWGPGAAAKLPPHPHFDRPLTSMLTPLAAIAKVYSYNIVD